MRLNAELTEEEKSEFFRELNRDRMKRYRDKERKRPYVPRPKKRKLRRDFKKMFALSVVGKPVNYTLTLKRLSKPTIKECFYLDKKGRCSSLEIYRKVEGMETGKLCPFKLDDLVFGTNNPYDMRCLEFTPRREE